MTTPSLMHGGFIANIREGFEDPFKETKKLFKNKKDLTWPDEKRVDLTQTMDESIDNYQKLYCLKKGPENPKTKWNFGEQVKEGADIGPLVGSGGPGGKCIRPKKWKVEHGDKILKYSGGGLRGAKARHWYVNKYGFIKSINPVNPLCTQKDIVTLEVPPDMTKYHVYHYQEGEMKDYSNNSHIQACDSGNYNLQYCENGFCNYAYLSPSGKLKKYGTNWSTDENGKFKNPYKMAIKDTACYALPVVKSMNINDKSMSFIPLGEEGKQWNSKHIDDSKFENINSKDFDIKGKAVAECFPYSNDSGNKYDGVLSNKIKSDLKMRWIEEEYVKRSNELLETQEEIEKRKDEMLKDDGHATANKYMIQMNKLKELRQEFESTKDYRMTISKINSENLQRWMWIGSALALGSISIKLIQGI